jgi:hypothetical protein
MLSGNKGDWSEIYTLFKLLGDKQLYGGDANLNKIEDLFYPIIKIIRAESGGNFEFEISGDLVIISGGIEELRVSIQDFREQAAILLKTIKDSTGYFKIPETEVFMNSINCGTLKAKATSKTDILIVIHDPKINQNAELGFSIKSKLGNEATLLNAGKTTNFIFEVKNLNKVETDIIEINSIETRNKIQDRLNAMERKGGILVFDSLEQAMFKNNLVLIDSLLPNIISEIIKLFFTTSLTSVKSLTDAITISNPLNFDNKYSHTFYEYKVKRFLTDVALGMTPSKVWSGLYDASGGYLVVKENGDILCYHIYNRNKFEDYLFENTKLETASSTRHEFGMLYSENNKLFIKLNLQIRFK